MILPTFALEPEALISNGYEHCKNFSEKFGFTTGRLISRFPKNGMKICLEKSNLGDSERHKIVERIIWLKNKNAFISSNLDFDTSQEWLNNAIKNQNAFAAIIANRKIEYYEKVLYALETDEDTPLFKVERDDSITRTAEKMALCASPLLKNSREILFVDPYFAKQAHRKWNWIEPIQKFLQTATNNGRELSICEYHFKEEGLRGTIDRFMETYRRDLENAIPSGIEMKLFSWKEVNKNWHGRYILTEVGGIKFDCGLDCENETEKTDVNILGEALYKERWNDFQEETSPYELVEKYPISIRGRKKS